MKRTALVVPALLIVLSIASCSKNFTVAPLSASPSTPVPTGTSTSTATPTPSATPTNTLQTPSANTTMTATPNPGKVHLSPTITVTPLTTPTPSGRTPTITPTPLPASWTLFATLGQAGTTVTDGSNGYFQNVMGIAIGNGFIAVGDEGVEDVQVFDSNGQYLYTITPTGATPDLFGLAMDSNGELYVADAGDGVIQGFFLGPTGATYDYSWSGQGTFTAPDGVKIDGQGNLVVCDGSNSAVYSVAWSDDTLLATSTGNPGNYANSTYSPNDVALDAGGNPYVADYDSYGTSLGRVAQYNTGYAYTGSISGLYWTLPLNNPVYSLIPDSQNNFFVSDTTNTRVVYMDNQGTYLGEIDGFQYPTYLAVDASNDLFVVDTGANQVLEYNP